jgi:hypothetical protein
MILDLTFDKITWRLINFYNNVNDHSALDTLLSLNLDPIVLTLVTGNFNSQHPLPHLVPRGYYTFTMGEVN